MIRDVGELRCIKSSLAVHLNINAVAVPVLIEGNVDLLSFVLQENDVALLAAVVEPAKLRFRQVLVEFIAPACFDSVAEMVSDHFQDCPSLKVCPVRVL